VYVQPKVTVECLVHVTTTEQPKVTVESPFESELPFSKICYLYFFFNLLPKVTINLLPQVTSSLRISCSSLILIYLPKMSAQFF